MSTQRRNTRKLKLSMLLLTMIRIIGSTRILIISHSLKFKIWKFFRVLEYQIVTRSLVLEFHSQKLWNSIYTFLCHSWSSRYSWMQNIKWKQFSTIQLIQLDLKFFNFIFTIQYMFHYTITLSDALGFFTEGRPHIVNRRVQTIK